MAYRIAVAPSHPRSAEWMVHVRREAPIHVLMVGVMAVTMLAGSVALTVLGAGALLATSIVCAALSRGRPFLREHVVDLWAMALVLLVFLPSAQGSGHSHLVEVPQMASFVAIVLLWIGARVWLARGSSGWRASLASALVTAAGLGLMAAFCA